MASIELIRADEIHPTTVDLIPTKLPMLTVVRVKREAYRVPQEEEFGSLYEAIDAWLESDAAKGEHIRATERVRMHEVVGRWTHEVFMFTDPDTAFAFKLRFG